MVSSVSRIPSSQEYDVLAEVEKSKKVLNPYYGQSTISSCSPLGSLPTLTVSRPSLDPPKSSEERLLRNNELLSSLHDQIFLANATSIEHTSKAQDKAQEEFIRKLHEESVKIASDITYWSTIQNIASCFSTASTAILGASLIVGGGSALLGGVLIFAGVSMHAHTLLNNLGVYDKIANFISNGNETLRKNISTYLPGVIGLVCIAASLSGAGVSLAAGNLGSLQTVLTTVSTMANFAHGLADAKKGLSEKALQQTEAEQKSLSVEIALGQDTLTTYRKSIESVMKDFNDSTQYSRSIMQLVANRLNY